MAALNRRTEKALISFAGTCLTGKTTLARNVSGRLCIPHIDVDDVRSSIFPTEMVGIILPPEQESAVMLNCYVEMYRRAKRSLDKGTSVIANATHSRELYHEIAKQTAHDASVPLVVVLLDIGLLRNPQEFLAERLLIRSERHDSASNVVGNDALEYAIKVYERYKPFSEKGVNKLIRIDPALKISRQAEHVINELRDYIKVARRE